MWELLQKHLTLDPPTPISGGVYLGVKQHSIEPPEDMIKAKNALYHDLFTKKILKDEDIPISKTQLRKQKEDGDVHLSAPACSKVGDDALGAGGPTCSKVGDDSLGAGG